MLTNRKIDRSLGSTYFYPVVYMPAYLSVLQESIYIINLLVEAKDHIEQLSQRLVATTSFEGNYNFYRGTQATRRSARQ